MSMRPATDSSGPGMGLVHDYLLTMRGAERSFSAITECFPSAAVYTLLLDRANTSPYFDGRQVTTSYLQRLRVSQNGFRRLLPFFPRAVEHLPIRDHDVVISSSSAFAHGVRPKPGATHLCYCYTPFRYVYYERRQALAEIPRPARRVMNAMFEGIRRWDQAAAKRVDHYIAISKFSQRRIAECYGRDATILHPPVDIDRFQVAEPEDFFLVVTEVVRHKRVELALEAARRAGTRVKVVGSGPDLPRLKALYGETADFLGRIPDSELDELCGRALALIVPNVEEFGIAMVEAQAAGRPVVAADGGGAQEIVITGKTGELVPVGDVDALAEAMREIDFRGYATEDMVANASRFSQKAFCQGLTAKVGQLRGTSEARN